MYTGANSIALVSEMHNLVNRTAIQLLSQDHRIRDKMRTLRRHVHRQAGANCTDAKLYFWTVSIFFYPNGTWTHPPTSKLFFDFLNFFNFAKPLRLDICCKHEHAIQVACSMTWYSGIDSLNCIFTYYLRYHFL